MLRRLGLFILLNLMAFQGLAADAPTVSQLKARVEALSLESAHLKDLSIKVMDFAEQFKGVDAQKYQEKEVQAAQLSQRADALLKIQEALFKALENPTEDRLEKIEAIIVKTETEIRNTNQSRVALEQEISTPAPSPSVETVTEVEPEVQEVAAAKPETIIKVDSGDATEDVETPEAEPLAVATTPITENKIIVTPLDPIQPEDPIQSEFQRRLRETPAQTYERLNRGEAFANPEINKSTPEEVFVAIEHDFREEAGEDIEPKDIEPVQPTASPHPETVTIAKPVSKEEPQQVPQAEPQAEPQQDLVETISPEEYAEQRAQALKEKFKDQLEEKLPITKSIRVYDTDTGRERWLREGQGYTIRPVGFGPRNSIRVKVYNNEGLEVPGDFITLQANVRDGTIQNNAQKSIRALELIRASYNTDLYGDEPVCKPAENDALVNEPIPTVATEPILESDDPNTDYLPHCEVLADGIQNRDREKLKRCIRSIHSAIKANGTRRCQVIQKLFSLNEKEQDFAALVFTTVGEAPAGLPSGSADHLMIMKSLENRESAVKRAGWREPLNKLDLALVPLHFSMFNNHRGRFVSSGFLNASNNMDRIIDSVVDYQSATWAPPGEINNITHYYSPPAMVPKNRKIWWARPDQNPNRTLREIKGIRVNGQPVVNRNTSPNGYHLFYAGVDGPNNYATIRRSRNTLGRCQ